MTKNSILSALALVFLFALASCSSSDDDEKLPFDPIEQTFTDAAGLTLNYSGEPMVGKSVKVVPSASDVHKATLILAGDNQLGDVADALFPGLSGSIECPGVLPGSPSANIEVNMKADATGFSFAGDSESEYCTFSYSGRLESTGLKLDLTEVKLKNTALAGATWKLCPYSAADFGTTSSPLTIVWEPKASASIDFAGSPYPLQDLLTLVATLVPIVPNPTDPVGDKLTVAHIMSMLLNTVTFGEDGNISANYLDTKTGQMTTSPVNLAQYVITGDGKMLFFLNPQAVIADTQKSRSEINVSGILAQLVPMLGRYLTAGFPLDYKLDGNKLTAAIGTEPLLTILKATVVPMLSDPAMLKQIEDMIAGNDDMAEMAPLIIPIIKSVPAAINATTNIQLGLNFTK